jgi:hypothetical protein
MTTGNDKPTPETDEAFNGNASAGLHPTVLTWDDARAFARRLERERDEARTELRRCHNEYIEVSHDREAKMETLQSSHDAAWRRYNETDAAYQAALDENQALRDALRVAAGQRDGTPCPECGLDAAHFDDCRHYATEQAVL